MIYEKVTIDMLRPGVPFYRLNPIEYNHDVLPDYNIGELNPDDEVWVVYPDWESNPFIKPEHFHKGENLVLRDLINSRDSSFF